MNTSHTDPQHPDSTANGATHTPADAPMDTAANISSPTPAELQAELKEWQDKAYRLAAELENAKKRAEKDLLDARQYAISNFAKDLLSVADNMDRALAAITQAEQTEASKPLQEGVAIVAYQLSQCLQRFQVLKIDALNTQADPERHQIIQEIPHTAAANTIVQELQSGYTLHGRLLRPALVVVSSGEPPAAEPVAHPTEQPMH